MSEKRAFIRAASVVAAITALSRALGLVRDSVVGTLLGASRINDVFQIAFELPNLARRVLGEGSLSAYIVPLFSAERRDKGEQGGWEYASNAITSIALVSSLLSILGMFFARPIFLVFGGLGILKKDGDAAAVELGVQLTRIMFPYLSLLATAALLMGLCHTLKRFTWPAFGSILLNIAMIGASLLFWMTQGSADKGAAPILKGALDPAQIRFAHWLSVSVLVGAALRILTHAPPLRAEGFRYRPRMDWSNPRLRELFAKMPMAIAGMMVTHVMISINTFFATYMGEGYATQLRYASRLVQLPLGMVATAMATAILPQLTLFLHEGKREALSELYGFALRLMVILFMPASAGLIAMGRPICALLFEYKNWTPEATAGTAWALMFYSLGLLPNAALLLTQPLYYSKLDLRTPVVSGAIAVAVNVAMNYAFYKWTDLKQGGLALSTALAMSANVAYLTYQMRGEIRGAADAAMLETFWKTLVSATVMGLAVYGWRVWFDGMFGQASFGPRAILVGGGVVLSVALYFGLAAALRTPDLRRVLQLARRRSKT